MRRKGNLVSRSTSHIPPHCHEIYVFRGTPAPRAISSCRYIPELKEQQIICESIFSQPIRYTLDTAVDTANVSLPLCLSVFLSRATMYLSFAPTFAPRQKTYRQQHPRHQRAICGGIDLQRTAPADLARWKNALAPGTTRSVGAIVG